MAKLEVFTQKNFKGGISDSSREGVKGSFRFGFGLDIQSDSEALSCNQKLKKESGEIVKDLILFMVTGTDGVVYAFGDKGYIYSRQTDGTWSYITADADGKIWGAAIFPQSDATKGYIIYATKNSLKRAFPAGLATPDTLGSMAYSAGGNLTWHTMIPALGVLMYCDGPYIGMFDFAGAFNAKALTLPGSDNYPKVKAESLIESGDVIMIGARDIGGEGRAYLFTWDKVALSWLSKKDMQASSVNSIEFLESGVIIQTGTGLKYWDTINLVPKKTIPGNGSTNPGAHALYNSRPYFGVRDGTRDGVYSYGRKDDTKSLALNLEYLISPIANQSTLALMEEVLAARQFEIGSVCNANGTLLVSWAKRGLVTMTIANPAVFTWRNEVYPYDIESHHYTDGQSISFTTAGALPTGITANTLYYVRIIDATTFHLYDTYAHAIDLNATTGRVVTTGTQSGLHTGSMFGVDTIDTANKAIAVYESLESDFRLPAIDKLGRFIKVCTKPLPAGTSVSVWYRMNGSTTWIAATTDSGETSMHTTGQTKEIFSIDGQGETMEIKLQLTPSANLTPEVVSINTYFEQLSTI